MNLEQQTNQTQETLVLYEESANGSICCSSSESEGETECIQIIENEHDDLLILLDWDDTLFPTSMINDILHSRDNNDLALVRDDQILSLTKLGNHTLLLLNTLIAKYGANNIHIVTNSLHGWIEQSLCYAACISKIYKEIETVLIENNITMISAQSMYANKVDAKHSTPTIWKQLCFDDLLKSNKTKNTYSHIVSIGDQWTDHYAVKQSIQSLTAYNPIHHIIKLKMSPNADDMINEMLYIDTCFNQIFDVISSKKSSYFTGAKSVSPVIIDYHHEEMKHYYNHCQLNISNETLPPKQYMK